MEKLTHAIKEWSAVVDALGQGIQTLLSRKYPPAYNKLVLYSTYGFSHRRKYLSLYFQPQYHEFVEISVKSKKKGKTEISYYAEVHDVISISRSDFDKLRNLRDHYIWSPEHVFNYYFKDEKCKEAYIWILRIYKISEPQSIEDLGRGAVTYANLPIEISTAGCKPIMDDSKFKSTIKEIKRDLEPEIDVQAILEEKERMIQELRKLVEQKEERIRQLESQIGPTPLEVIIRKLDNVPELSPGDLEWTLTQAFEELGFDAKWNGELKEGKPLQVAPQGKPDAEVKAPLAGDPYFIVLEATKNEEERYQVTEVHGAVDHSNVFPGPPFKTCYRLVVAPRFRKGAIEACEKIDPRYPVMLLRSDNFLEILRFHSEVGGITQEELKNLFDRLEGRGEVQRRYIEEWENVVREQRKKLSLALDAYDILYSDKGFMWPREIWRQLKKQRTKQGLPVVSLGEIYDILMILDTIGAVVVKPSPDGDIEKFDYKAGLTPEGFRLRIRKLEETIRLHESKQPKRRNKLISWIREN